ncbi:hypothetical protein GIB67_038232, partial [Kingdonia uniflora]
MASSTAKAVKWDSAYSNNLDPFDRTTLGVHDSVYEAQAPAAAMANAKIPSQIINNVPRMVSAPTVASSFHHLKLLLVVTWGLSCWQSFFHDNFKIFIDPGVEDLRCKGFRNLLTTMIVQPDVVVNILLANQDVKSPPKLDLAKDNKMEDSCEPDWSKVIGDELPPRAANERTTGVGSGTPDCTADSLFVETSYEGKTFDTMDEASSFYEKYGRMKRFSTKKRNSKKRPRSEEIARATFCCLSIRQTKLQ